MPAENRTLAGAGGRSSAKQAGTLVRSNSSSTAITGSSSKVASDTFTDRAKAERELRKLTQLLDQRILQITELSVEIRARRKHLAEMEKQAFGDREPSKLSDLQAVINQREELWDRLQDQSWALNSRIKDIKAVILATISSTSTPEHIGTVTSVNDVSLSKQTNIESELENTKIAKRPTPDHDQVRINYPLPPEILAGRKK
jgi:hypothetical protein